MTQPALYRRIFREMRKALTVPFTVKFRAGWEVFGAEAFEVAHAAQEEGLDALTLHARTREQGYKGRADWSLIARLKQAVRLPVIGNGDVTSADDAVVMMRDHRADAVMVGRACMGNPWIFREIIARFRGLPDPPSPTAEDRLDMTQRHAELMVMRKGEELGLREFRKHVVQYMKGFPFARDMKTELMGCHRLEEYHVVLERGRERLRLSREFREEMSLAAREQPPAPVSPVPP
jgi:nifR3 family TIM-barrel protein